MSLTKYVLLLFAITIGVYITLCYYKHLNTVTDHKKMDIEIIKLQIKRDSLHIKKQEQRIKVITKYGWINLV